MVRMRFGYGAQCVHEQPDARSHVEFFLIAVPVNLVALYVLENKKRLAGERHSCVNQVGDVRMFQAAQNAAFALEPFFAGLSYQRDIKNLHRDAPLKPPIVALRQPYRAHSPMADLRNQGVDAKCLTCEPRASWQFQCAYFEKTFIGQSAVLTEQYFQLICEGWILTFERCEPGGALIVGHFQRLVEVGAKSLPFVRGELRHGSLKDR